MGEKEVKEIKRILKTPADYNYKGYTFHPVFSGNPSIFTGNVVIHSKSDDNSPTYSVEEAVDYVNSKTASQKRIFYRIK